MNGEPFCSPVLVSVLAGVLLGLSLAAPPGPMNAVIAEETVLRGWRPGVLAGLGAMAADVCFFLLAAIGAATFVESAPRLRAAMLMVGGLLMLWFGFDAIRGQGNLDVEGTMPVDRGFRRAFVLGLTNPYQILWWVAVGVAMLDPTGIELGAGLPGAGQSPFTVAGGPPIVFGLFLGIGVWITAFPTVLTYAEDRIAGFGPVIAAVSGLVLLGFGVIFIASGLGGLLA